MHSPFKFIAAALAALVLAGCQSNPPVAIPVDLAGLQEQRFAAAFQEVETQVARKAFPGAVLAVGVKGRLVALKAFGRLDSAPNALPMPVDAIFDVASLTKVAATTTAAALLYDQGRLELDAPVARYIPEFAGVQGHDGITVRHLLSHSAGLPSPMLLWKHANNREDLLKLVYQLPAQWPPGTHFDYRDENFILLGEIVERISGQRLDRFLADRAFGPLGMRDTGFNPSPALLARIPPTEQDTYFRHALVRGTVHDENAHVMGGVSGHAGLFSTAADLARLAQFYLNQGQLDGQRLLRPQTITTFTTLQELPPGSTRALGWDTPSKTGAFSGPLASADAIVHTGFTGTSIYIDRSRNAFVILLTNRVNPSRENRQIGTARVAIHTAVLSALDAGAAR